MIPLKLEALQKHLRDQSFDAQLQKETQQVYVILKIAGVEFPFFLRIFEQSDLLQLLVFIPIGIKPGAHADLARFLHHLNKELDIPGFGMDEAAGVSFYRCMLPTTDQQIDERVFDAYLKSIIKICETMAGPVIAVANGQATYSDILRKAKEVKKPPQSFKL